MFKYYNSNRHCKTEHIEKYKNSTFASKAAKSSTGFLFRVTHPSMESSFMISHIYIKKPPVNSLMVNFSPLIDLVKTRSIENVPLFRQNVTRWIKATGGNLELH